MSSLLEPTAPHLTYLTLSLFLILYALFSALIRDRFHLSEPPLAVLVGILLGPSTTHLLPITANHHDAFTLELTRVILGIQCFAVGIELPAHYLSTRRHRNSLATLLAPTMLTSFALTSALAHVLFQPPSISASLLIGAALSPTDPILAASLLSDTSRFASRIPRRLRTLLSAESASNDGTSFPLLYLGLTILLRSTDSTVPTTIGTWFLRTLLYRCLLGLILGLATGRIANSMLRCSVTRGYVLQPGLIVFHLLLALLSIGIASTLGLDDFLAAFGAGLGFAHGGWFGAKQPVNGSAAASASAFRQVVDLVLNAGVFVYFGAILPFSQFAPSGDSFPEALLVGHVTVGRLFLFLGLVLLLRRIPVVMALHAAGGWCFPLLPDVKTYAEALFVGHFGPMGVGALFLAVEARSQLGVGGEDGSTSLSSLDPPYDERAVAGALVWPVVCFVVLGSTVVHGLSVLAISIFSHFGHQVEERAPLLGGERTRFAGMVYENEESEDEVGDGAVR